HERIARIRRHPLFSLLLHDPVTYRGFHKPRGHAADAVMLDLVYQDESTPSGTSELGARLQAYMAAMPLAQALRNRRDWLAAQIDATAERTACAEVLAIESGHLREAQRSQAVKSGALRRFVALDHDAEAVWQVEREIGQALVRAMHTPTYALLNGGRNALGHFDFIYSAGLFERLDNERAKRAVAAMFAMLKPGGKIWISNIRPSVREAAYLEVFMNWWPTYRDLGALDSLIGEIPPGELRSHRSFLEPTDNIAFLEVIRV
ncbi:MAG TPA: class I SAM-dependent methyltransferase, partial [Candidatus Binataceae bacterium]|nr:class I SAM-dependent methyltransferase [Candidatus Binataceae bacterium]